MDLLESERAQAQWQLLAGLLSDMKNRRRRGLLVSDNCTAVGKTPGVWPETRLVRLIWGPRVAVN